MIIAIDFDGTVVTNEWPNTDHRGFILYTNNTFKTEKECAEYARSDMTYFLESIEQRARQNAEDAQKICEWIKQYRKNDNYLSQIESKYREEKV